MITAVPGYAGAVLAEASVSSYAGNGVVEVEVEAATFLADFLPGGEEL